MTDWGEGGGVPFLEHFHVYVSTTQLCSKNMHAVRERSALFVFCMHAFHITSIIMPNAIPGGYPSSYICIPLFEGTHFAPKHRVPFGNEFGCCLALVDVCIMKSIKFMLPPNLYYNIYSNRSINNVEILWRIPLSVFW